MSDIDEMMKSMMKTIASSYVDLGPIDKKDLDEWKDLVDESLELEIKGKELKARGELFWIKIEKKYDKVGEALKIDGDHLWLRKELTIKEMQEMDTNHIQADPSDI
jgi:hypothetical protein